MNGLDYGILVVVAISAVVGLWRGFMRETVSLLVWIAAFGIAMSFSSLLADSMSAMIASPSLRAVMAFILIFVTVMIIGVIVNYLLASLLKKTGLRTSDRMLGGLFGIVRGMLVVALITIVVELTPLVDSESWRESTIVAYLQPVMGQMQKYFPAEMHVGGVQGWGGFDL